jgi:hypothetical protein
MMPQVETSSPPRGRDEHAARVEAARSAAQAAADDVARREAAANDLAAQLEAAHAAVLAAEAEFGQGGGDAAWKRVERARGERARLELQCAHAARAIEAAREAHEAAERQARFETMRPEYETLVGRCSTADLLREVVPLLARVVALDAELSAAVARVRERAAQHTGIRTRLGEIVASTGVGAIPSQAIPGASEMHPTDLVEALMRRALYEARVRNGSGTDARLPAASVAPTPDTRAPEFRGAPIHRYVMEAVERAFGAATKDGA